MKKILMFILAVACILALCACGDSGEYDPTDTQETVPPTAVQTEPTEETELALPWEVPALQEPLSYEEYFSEVRSYDWQTDLHYRTTFTAGQFLTEYSVRQEGDSIQVVPYKTMLEAWSIGPAADFENCVWQIATPTRAFGIRDGKEIFSVDYLTGTQQTLYVDETGGLQGLVDGSEYRTVMVLADDQVLFFLAGAGENLGIYRMYLPNGQVDLLYGDIPIGSTPGFIPDGIYTSEAVSWTQSNPEFDALLEELNTPDSPYLQEYYESSEAEGYEPDWQVIYEILYDTVNYKFKTYQTSYHYFNAATGDSCKQEMNRTFYNPYGRQWWRMFLAQEDAYMYPFTAEEQEKALSAARSYIEECNEPSLPTVEKVALDPLSVDALCREPAKDDRFQTWPWSTLPAGWTQEDYYSNLITVSVTYQYHLADAPEVSYETVKVVTLLREDSSAVWRGFDSWDAESPLPELPTQAMSPEELASLEGVEGEIAAGYDLGGGAYYLFLKDDATGEIQFTEYHAAQ